MVKLTPPRAGRSKVATTTPKISIFFNLSSDNKVGYLGKLEFVDSHRAHRETFGGDPMISPNNPTNQCKTTTEKELYALYELCMFDAFIHIIGKFYVGTFRVEYARRTH